MPGESITCPVCQRTSYHHEVIREGYCGFCHDWTSENQLTRLRLPEEHPVFHEPRRESVDTGPILNPDRGET